MLISFMSFLFKFEFQLEFILGVRGEHQVMLKHSHTQVQNLDLCILICEEVKKIYRDHSYHPKIPSHRIVIPIYITQHDLSETTPPPFESVLGGNFAKLSA